MLPLLILPQVLPEGDLVVEEGEVALGQADHVLIRHSSGAQLKQNVGELPVGEESSEPNRINAEPFRCTADGLGSLFS